MKDLCTLSDVTGCTRERLQNRFTLDHFNRDQRRYHERNIVQVVALQFFRQRFGQQSIARTKQNRAYNDAFQLTNISRPIVPEQPEQCFLLDAANSSAVLPVELTEKVLCEQRDIVEAITQRRHFDLYRTDAKVEIFLQHAAFQQCCRTSTCCHNEAEVNT